MDFFLPKANDVLGREIRLCKKKYPSSEARTIPDFDLDLLTKDDKCYLYCIMNAQRLVRYFIQLFRAFQKLMMLYLQILNGSFNVDALEFTPGNPKIAARFRSQCAHIRQSDKCEFAAKLQKCIEIVIRKTPTSHFPSS